MARYAPLRNFIPKVFACTLAPLRPFPAFSTIFVYSHISLCSFFSPPERQLEGPRELQPCVRVRRASRRKAWRSPCWAPVRPRPWWRVPRPVLCPKPGRGCSGLSLGSAARRLQNTLRHELGTVPGGMALKQRTLLGAELNFLLESAALSAATRNCLVGAEGAACCGVGLCIAPSDPGEGSSVNHLNPLLGLHGTRAPFGPCLFLHLLPGPPLAGSSWPLHRHRPFPPLAPISPSPTVPRPSGLLCSIELPLFPFSPSASLISFSFFPLFLSLLLLVLSLPLSSDTHLKPLPCAPASPLCRPDGCGWLVGPDCAKAPAARSGGNRPRLCPPRPLARVPLSVHTSTAQRSPRLSRNWSCDWKSAAYSNSYIIN